MCVMPMQHFTSTTLTKYLPSFMLSTCLHTTSLYYFLTLSLQNNKRRHNNEIISFNPFLLTLLHEIISFNLFFNVFFFYKLKKSSYLLISLCIFWDVLFWMLMTSFDMGWECVLTKDALTFNSIILESDKCY